MSLTLQNMSQQSYTYSPLVCLNPFSRLMQPFRSCQCQAEMGLGCMFCASMARMTRLFWITRHRVLDHALADCKSQSHHALPAAVSALLAEMMLEEVPLPWRLTGEHTRRQQPGARLDCSATQPGIQPCCKSCAGRYQGLAAMLKLNRLANSLEWFVYSAEDVLRRHLMLHNMICRLDAQSRLAELRF